MPAPSVQAPQKTIRHLLNPSKHRKKTICYLLNPSKHRKKRFAICSTRASAKKNDLPFLWSSKRFYPKSVIREGYPRRGAQAYAPTKRRRRHGGFFGGDASDPSLPFLPLMKEKAAKEDQGAMGRRPSPQPGAGKFVGYSRGIEPGAGKFTGYTIGIEGCRPSFIGYF